MLPIMYRLALRRRLLMEGSRLLQGLGSQTLCQNTSKQGVVCGATIEPDQHRAIACETGGARTHRHDRVRDLLARWLAARVPGRVLTEQRVPQWQRTRHGVVEQAVLDVVWLSGEKVHAIDVTIVSADSAEESEERARAERPGQASVSAANEKRRRYPAAPGTPALTPFVIEVGGRIGVEARALVQRHLDWSEGEAGASADAVAFWQELSAVLQTAVGEQLLSAHRTPVLGGGRRTTVNS